MIVESLFSTIDRGKSGMNIGVSTGLPKLDNITYGIQSCWMTVIGGDSGSGKSSLCLYTAVYRPYMQYLLTGKKLNINWLLFSFELSSEVIFAKLLSIYIYEVYNRVISYGDILSFNQTISDEDYLLVCKSRPWLEELEAHCTIIDKPVTANALYAITKEWTKQFGVYEKVDEYSENYIQKNEKQLLIVTVDHLGLIETSNNNTKKQEMDKACDELIYFRNKCRLTIYIVQQLNRNFKSMSRRTEGSGQYAGIQLDDFSDTSGATNAAEIVISIFHPFREKMSEVNKYKIKNGLGDRARILTVLKHRFGQSDVSDGVAFYGEVGIWKELPPPNEIDDYEIYKNLN